MTSESPDAAHEALLLQAVLDPASLAEELGDEGFAALLAAPEHAREIEALRSFLGSVKRDLGGAEALGLDAQHSGVGAQRSSASARSIARVTRRVLARTTREERSWRGDLRLVSDFVTDRLRASVALRVAAALLLVHATVVPILAWHLLTREDRGSFRLRIERAPADPAFIEDLVLPNEAIGAPTIDPPFGDLLDTDYEATLDATSGPSGERLQRLGAAVLAAYGAHVGRPADVELDLVERADLSPLERELARRAFVLEAGGLDVGERAEQAPLGHATGGETTPRAGSEEGLHVERQAELLALLRLERALDRRALLGHDSALSARLAALDAAPVSPGIAAFQSEVRARARALGVLPDPRAGSSGTAVASAAAASDPTWDTAYAAALAGALAESLAGALAESLAVSLPGAREGSPASADGAGPWAAAWRAALGAR
ncbi:MAG: hypothetical protein R3F49_20295 [Planctomycetota bacterium]